MGGSYGMSELVELIFGRKSTIHEEFVPHSSSHANFLTEDFSNRLHNVLFIRKLIVFKKWQKSFIKDILKMLSSHEKYLTYVMCACLREQEWNRDIFDSFISVCALLLKCNEEILEITGVDYRDFNPDIFMVLYLNVLKGSFHKRKDFSRLLEFIRDHKYLTWNRNDHILADDPNAPILNEMDVKIEEKLRQERPFQGVKGKNSINHLFIEPLVKKVLLTTSVELPNLPSKPDLIRRLIAFTKKVIANKVETNRRVESAMTFHVCSNSETKSNDVAKQQEDIARHENIIQAVIRHNHSKRSGDENTNSHINEEADRIFFHLKNRIKSLNDILEACNKE